VGFSAFSLASPVACLHYALRKRAGKTVMLLRNNQITAQLDPGPGLVGQLRGMRPSAQFSSRCGWRSRQKILPPSHAVSSYWGFC
jgi:hypothetical protein